MNNRTKIVCTLGPASESEEAILNLVKAGMNVARLNFSHGTHENHGELIGRIRSVAKKMHEPVAVLQDVQGLKIRVGTLPTEGVFFKEGQTIVFDTASTPASGSIPIDFPDLHRFVK